MSDPNKFLEAISAAPNYISKDIENLPDLINNRYSELLTQAIDSGSEHLDKTLRKFNDVSHVLPVLFNRVESHKEQKGNEK